MEKIVNFQTSLFGSFINIKPRTAVVLSLLNNLKDESFIPGTIDLLSLNPVSGELQLKIEFKWCQKIKLGI